MMRYDSLTHHRISIRLHGYDYSQMGVCIARDRLPSSSFKFIWQGNSWKNGIK